MFRSVMQDFEEDPFFRFVSVVENVITGWLMQSDLTRACCVYVYNSEFAFVFEIEFLLRLYFN